MLHESSSMVQSVSISQSNIKTNILLIPLRVEMLYRVYGDLEVAIVISLKHFINFTMEVGI